MKMKMNMRKRKRKRKRNNFKIYKITTVNIKKLHVNGDFKI